MFQKVQQENEMMRNGRRPNNAIQVGNGSGQQFNDLLSPAHNMRHQSHTPGSGRVVSLLHKDCKSPAFSSNMQSCQCVRTSAFALLTHDADRKMCGQEACNTCTNRELALQLQESQAHAFSVAFSRCGYQEL